MELVQGGEMDCGPTCVRILIKAISGKDLGKICDEASEILPGRCVETRQLALALGRLLSPEHVRISFCFLFTEPWGFDFYQQFKAELHEDRAESMLCFYKEAANLDLSAESRSVSLEEIRSFFTPQADYEFPEFSCRAAIVLLDWSIVASFLAKSSKGMKVENMEFTGHSYFGHFCILIDIKGDRAVLIDPSSEEPDASRSHPVKGGRTRTLPLKVFEAARRSPGTDEDIVFVSWLPEPQISHLRKKPSWQLPDAFLSACYQGNTKLVLELKTTSVSVPPKGVRKLRTTPLIVASWRGHAEVVRLLLERRANPNEAEPATALWFAAEAGHFEASSGLIFVAYIELHRSVGVFAFKGWHYLSLLCYLSLFVVDTGIYQNAISVKHPYFILQATKSHTVQVLRLLLEHKGSLNIRDSAGRSALWTASKHGHVAVAELLLTQNAEIDGDSDGTALAVAAERGQLELVRPPCRILRFHNFLKCSKCLCKHMQTIFRRSFKHPLEFEWFEFWFVEPHLQIHCVIPFLSIVAQLVISRMNMLKAQFAF